MSERNFLFSYSQNYLNHGYKELEIPAGKIGNHQISKGHLHIWPRGDFMLIALPNMDGSFTVTLFLSYDEGEFNFENLTSEKKITEFTAYNKIVMYKTEITDFILMHNYLQSNHDYYVSSIDVMAFPNYTDEKNVETGTLIVWEKCDLMDEWTSLLLKKYFLGINGLSKQELQENESRIEIIENLIIIAGRDADD